jgi:hypothetical protein
MEELRWHCTREIGQLQSNARAAGTNMQSNKIELEIIKGSLNDKVDHSTMEAYLAQLDEAHSEGEMRFNLNELEGRFTILQEHMNNFGKNAQQGFTDVEDNMMETERSNARAERAFGEAPMR